MKFAVRCDSLRFLAFWYCSGRKLPCPSRITHQASTSKFEHRKFLAKYSWAEKFTLLLDSEVALRRVSCAVTKAGSLVFSRFRFTSSHYHSTSRAWVPPYLISPQSPRTSWILAPNQFDNVETHRTADSNLQPAFQPHSPLATRYHSPPTIKTFMHKRSFIPAIQHNIKITVSIFPKDIGIANGTT